MNSTETNTVRIAILDAIRNAIKDGVDLFDHDGKHLGELVPSSGNSLTFFPQHDEKAYRFDLHVST